MEVTVLTREELQEVIRATIQMYMVSQAPHQNQIQERPRSEYLNLQQAITLLKELGYPASKSRLYKLTASNLIPCCRYGNRLSFSAAELTEWISAQRRKPISKSDDVLRIALAAQKRKLQPLNNLIMRNLKLFFIAYQLSRNRVSGFRNTNMRSAFVTVQNPIANLTVEKLILKKKGLLK